MKESVGMKQYNVGILGATGAVGRQALQILAERSFPVNRLTLLSSERSAGSFLEFNGEIIPVTEAKPGAFAGLDLAIFSAGADVSKEFAQEAVRQGCVVIDNSNAFRLEPEVPLVVPEVNPEDVKWHRGIIANPNCSTIQMVVALKPLHDYARIRRIVVATYQAVSGTGLAAMAELRQQSQAVLAGRAVNQNVYPHPIAFNLIPQIDGFNEQGYTLEEMKMVNETRKILHDATIKITATAVRVPVFNSHAEAVNIETEKKITRQKALELLSGSPGVMVADDPENKVYPLPAAVAGKDEVFVGRIREDNSVENGLNLWIVADNLRKGAALNAVQIAELLLQYQLI